MKVRGTHVSMWLAGAILIASATANAYGEGTPDEQPPAQEQVCDEAGLNGAALGLCVAFCEANDCDALDQPDDPACSTLRVRYARITGQLFLPCETVWYPIP